MLAYANSAPAHLAVVARTDPVRDAERYLLVSPAGPAVWVEDPEAATPFASLREATRMAMRLPARDRAYGLPVDAEWTPHATH